jgi:hypothetical protein
MKHPKRTYTTPSPAPAGLKEKVTVIQQPFTQIELPADQTEAERRESVDKWLKTYRSRKLEA